MVIDSCLGVHMCINLSVSADKQLLSRSFTALSCSHILKPCGHPFFRVTSNVYELFSIVYSSTGISRLAKCFVYDFNLCCGQAFFDSGRWGMLYDCMGVGVSQSLLCLPWWGRRVGTAAETLWCSVPAVAPSLIRQRKCAKLSGAYITHTCRSSITYAHRWLLFIESDVKLSSGGNRRGSPSVETDCVLCERYPNTRPSLLWRLSSKSLTRPRRGPLFLDRFSRSSRPRATTIHLCTVSCERGCRPTEVLD